MAIEIKYYTERNDITVPPQCNIILVQVFKLMKLTESLSLCCGPFNFMTKLLTLVVNVCKH